MNKALRIVTGAPGSGKSTVIEHLLEYSSSSNLVFLDIDLIADSASALAKSSIYTDPDTWKPYGKIWFDLLKALAQNGKVPVWFCPNTPQDFQSQDISFFSEIDWLLLDCDDPTRLKRLSVRNWNESKIKESLEDAQELRELNLFTIDTSHLKPELVANEIIKWLECS
ncbi:AAA family ATPase [Vibrio maritimus]|uniref:AAA family ATPase n=1 Tax=Vibrio maritimus TaxID=990268 RepID=UPI001F4591E4|nr:AAA family ATPase [Vibrio maritimus]